MRVLAAVALAAAGFSLTASAFAGPAGEVTHVSGAVVAQKPDGQSRILSVKSKVEEGDVIATADNSYARVKFGDGGEAVLRPGSQVKIDRFNFEEQKPQSDGMLISLLKGGMRAVTGLLGKRNPAAVRVATPSATIGIRGTTFSVLLVPEGSNPGPRSAIEGPADFANALKLIPEFADLSAPSGDAMKSIPSLPKNLAGFDTTLRVAQQDPNEPPATPAGGTPEAGIGGAGAVGVPIAIGLILAVADGEINLTNNGGSQNFAAGQFGFVANSNTKPVVTPPNPAVQFTPPPSFQAPSGLPGAGIGKAGALACTI